MSHRQPRSSVLTALLLAIALLAALFAPSAEAATGDVVVVANRGSGDLSVISTDTLSVETIDLPGEAEPMYVNHDRRNDQIFVGDRASSTIVALDDATYEVRGVVDVGEGVFHQWYDRSIEQLWVVGDTSQTVSVVDADSLTVLATIDMPADLVERGGRPHDVFVKGSRAFVSMLGVDGDIGVVLRYSTRSFKETGRFETGDDPHLFLDGNKIYVASQDASTVSRYNARTLELLASTDVPSAHGIYITPGGEVLVTNIAGGGVDGVWELNKKLTVQRSMADTVPTPHNLTIDRSRQAWVTHSGPTADQVSIVDLERRGFGDSSTVTVGMNPFGLAFVRG